MRGIQHWALGLAVGTTGALVLADAGIQQAGFVFACCAGSLYPDMDIPTSTLGRALCPVSTVLNRLFGHRGFLHTPIHLLACVLLLAYLCRAFGFGSLLTAAAFGLGHTAHLVQDTFTSMGIKWLWPCKKDFRLIGIRSDNRLLCWILTIAIFFLLWVPILFLLISIS